VTSERSESLPEPGPVPASTPTPAPAPSVTSLRAAIAGQRRIVQVGALLMLAALVICTGIGEPAIGAFLAIGILLAIANAVFTEHSMARMVASGELLSKKQFAASAMMRLGAVSLVGFGLVVLFWPDGVAVLFGLAVFQVMTLLLQGIPLLKELHKL
jgi:hypothetical protein